MKLALEIFGYGVGAFVVIGIILLIIAVFFTDYSK